MRKFIYILFIILSNDELFSVQQESARQEYIMTVFIHGTVSPNPSIITFFRWFKNMLQGKRSSEGIGGYQEYVEQVKRDGIHRYQPINKLGLVPVEREKFLPKKDLGYIGQHTANFYEKIDNLVYGNHKLLFYTFCWDGRLSQKYRLAAARDLYPLLLKEQERLAKKYGCPIKMCLGAHSHGCNVLLNLDQVEKEQQRGLFVDKVVFYGAPVQSETEKKVRSKIFGKVYSVFSDGDHLQRLDCISTKDHFSRQVFGTDKKNLFELPSNLKQISVEFGDCHPFHYELWLWGRKSFPYFFYRKRVPIHPIPLSVFTPIIIDLADRVSMDCSDGDICVLRFDTERSLFFMRDRKATFFQPIDIKALKQQAYSIL